LTKELESGIKSPKLSSSTPLDSSLSLPNIVDKDGSTISTPTKIKGNGLTKKTIKFYSMSESMAKNGPK
jgi:hypothetical protein